MSELGCGRPGVCVVVMGLEGAASQEEGSNREAAEEWRAESSCFCVFSGRMGEHVCVYIRPLSLWSPSADKCVNVFG